MYLNKIGAITVHKLASCNTVIRDRKFNTVVVIITILIAVAHSDDLFTPFHCTCDIHLYSY